MTSITNWSSPTNGSIIGPNMWAYYTTVVDTSPAVLRWVLEATSATYGLKTDNTYAGGFDMNGTIEGGLVLQDLPDSTWTVTIKLYSGTTWDYYAADGTYGARTLLQTLTSRTVTTRSTVTATPVSPAGGYWTGFSPDPSAPTYHAQLFQWNFGSDNLYDYQNGFTIEVRRNDTQAAVATFTAPVGSESATSYVGLISQTYKDILLEWRMRATNRYGTNSPYTSWSTFGFASPPVSSISTPVNNAALTSGVINIVTTATTTGGRNIVKTEASIYQGTTLIWSRVANNVYASGTNLTINDSTFILPQSGGTPYTLKVKHTDSLGTVSTEISRNFTVTYTSPTAAGAPTVNAANYDSDGYITVTWNNTGVDSAFYAWVLERRVRPLDPYTGAQIDAFGSWTEVGRVYINGTSFTYQDFSAPANSYLEYRVKQIAIRDGYQVISSTATAGTGVSAITTAYWLVNLTPVTTGTTTVTTVGGTALKLWNVTGDQYKRERVRNQYNLIGRGRYVEEGDQLGISGTLNAQIRDSGTTLARQKRVNLQAFQDTSSRFNFRNPFGDSINVNIGDIDVTRIPGTGKSEFVDITIPYSEVS